MKQEGPINSIRMEPAKVYEISRYLVIPNKYDDIIYQNQLNEESRLIRLIASEWRGTITLLAKSHKIDGDVLDPKYDEKEFEGLAVSVIHLDNRSEEIKKFADTIYKKLQIRGYKYAPLRRYFKR